LSGGIGSDQLNGSAGNDTIEGGEDGDAIIGSTGNDYIRGDNGNDILLGVNPGITITPNTEVDTLIGGLGADVFVLAGSGGNYYNDGIIANSGTGSYSVINGFDTTIDSITLKGGLNYVFGASAGIGLPSGVALFVNDDGVTGLTANDELISIFPGLSLSNSSAIASRFNFI
jgi:hypothetical protein